MVDIKQWNSAAASNTLSPPDGAPEGWAPADVNNVIREIMGAVRRQYEDPDFTDYDHTPTFVTAISFLIAGDHTARYSTDRRIRADDGGTLLYGDIISRTSTGGVNTTVIVELDSGALTSSLTGVAVGILTPAGHPAFKHEGSISGALAVGGLIQAGSLLVSGEAIFEAAIRGGTLSISGTVVAKGVFRAGSISVSGDAVIDGELKVGTFTVSGEAVIAGNLSLGSTAVFGGKATFKDDISLSGLANILGQLRGGTIVTSGTLSVGSTIVTSAGLRANSLSVTGVAAITGATIFGSTVTISGKATFKNLLSVSGTLLAPQIRLGGDPTVDLGAATKQYVDANQGVTKVWGHVDRSGGTPSLSAPSLNISGVTDDGAGNTIITIGTNFSTGVYAAGAAGDTVNTVAMPHTVGAGAFDVEVRNTESTLQDTADFSCWAFGDQ